jgi:hypothetical protein
MRLEFGGQTEVKKPLERRSVKRRLILGAAEIVN